MQNNKIYAYIINQIPPSNNKFIGRMNRWEYQNIKKDWAKLISLLCTPKPHKPLQKATVKLTYYFKTKTRRDPDNYSGKLILDGLVRAGIIRDDSFDVVTLRLVGKYDKNNPRTEIEITDLSQKEEKWIDNIWKGDNNMTIEQLKKQFGEKIVDEKIKWLKRASFAKRRLDSLEFRLERDTKKLQKASKPCGGNDKGKSDGRVNNVETALLDLAETQEEYDAFKIEYNNIRSEIKNEIKKLHDYDQESIFDYLYLSFIPMEQIAVLMHYDVRTISRKYCKGLEKLLKLSGNVR